VTLDFANDILGYMQHLKLADDLFEGIYDGSKTTTIRAGWRTVDLGPLRFIPTSGADHSALVNVKRISYCRAKDITDEQARADGARDAREIVLALQRFYPDLDDKTCVTVIEFDNHYG
jgi:hypothetical protein